MLESLYIKNFALIKEVNIDFKNHLNILTGETGSGKSILIDSINLALGKRATKDIIREGDNEVVISLSFVENNKDILNQIKDMDIPVNDDNKVILYRKISQEKNLSKINDIPCTLSKIKNVADNLIDKIIATDGEINYEQIGIGIDEVLEPFISSNSDIDKNKIFDIINEITK